MIGPVQTIVSLTVVTIDVVLTPLMDARDLFSFDSLLFAFINDGTTPFDAFIETGEAADSIDDEVRPTLTVSSGTVGRAGQRTLIIGPSQLRSWYRVSAQASSAPLSARWGLRGVLRAVPKPTRIRS